MLQIKELHLIFFYWREVKEMDLAYDEHTVIYNYFVREFDM